MEDNISALDTLNAQMHNNKHNILDIVYVTNNEGFMNIDHVLKKLILTEWKVFCKLNVNLHSLQVRTKDGIYYFEENEWKYKKAKYKEKNAS